MFENKDRRKKENQLIKLVCMSAVVYLNVGLKVRGLW